MQLSQWLRLEAIWEPGSHIMPERVTSWGSGGWMCRVYLCISLGALQPLFLLTAMLLCQQSIRRANAQEAYLTTSVHIQHTGRCTNAVAWMVWDLWLTWQDT